MAPVEPSALIATSRGALLCAGNGAVRAIGRAELGHALAEGLTPLLCHRVWVQRRLDLPPFEALDLLELFAFVHPASACVPTPRGLAAALGIPAPENAAGEGAVLHRAARLLLAELGASGDGEALAIARIMARLGWRWGRAVLEALAGAPEQGAGFAVWRRLPEIEQRPPPPPAGSLPVDPVEARRRLASLLGTGAEARPAQADYASAASFAFLPRDQEEAPRLVLAEAGTGVGKTLGYLAPASLWAERNRGTVWVSTFTRALQRQIDQELDRVYPAPGEKSATSVVRKGRENYLCLLNFEEAAQSLSARPLEAVALGLVARWIAQTRDGDLSGGDFPGWLPDLVGRARTLGLADRRGECIHGGCAHYDRCFVERVVRQSREARIVVANHALVMAQAVRDEAHPLRPARLVFDEGHHLFDAADAAFSTHLTAQEGVELRRWILGSEGGASRARGLARRVLDLPLDQAGESALRVLLAAAHGLPAEGWVARLNEGRPHGPVEAFLAMLHDQVRARAERPDETYRLEAELNPPIEGLEDAARVAAEALAMLKFAGDRLRQRLRLILESEAETLDQASRERIDALAESLQRRVIRPLAAYVGMLETVGQATPPDFVDWCAVERRDGRILDVGLHRHWLDPSRPFAEAVLAPAHGALVTSATLTDGGAARGDWSFAERRVGSAHLGSEPIRASLASPFDYPRQTRVLILTDVRKDDPDQIASAYLALFRAARGGALGLFTAINRLRAVRERIRGALEADGLTLLAQHFDGLEPGSLIEIFRAEPGVCLLGTDALRDGIDVPGEALRLIVFDRVPWPRPDILHRARKHAFGGTAYDDALVRLRLKQAYGRLVRRAGDRGVFVILDRALPSRLTDAFPDGVIAERIGLAEAIRVTRDFLDPQQAEPAGA